MHYAGIVCGLDVTKSPVVRAHAAKTAFLVSTQIRFERDTWRATDEEPTSGGQLSYKLTPTLWRDVETRLKDDFARFEGEKNYRFKQLWA